MNYDTYKSSVSKFAMVTGIVVATLGLTAPSALADECTDTIAIVSQTAESAGLSAADMDVVNAAKTEATARQETGDTEGCMASLAGVKQMLNLE